MDDVKEGTVPQEGEVSAGAQPPESDTGGQEPLRAPADSDLMQLSFELEDIVGFGQAKGLDAENIPLEVAVGDKPENKKFIELARLAVAEVFRSFGYELPDIGRLKFGMANIQLVDGQGNLIAYVAETYAPKIPAVYVAPPGFFDNYLREQLSTRYNIPTEASIDYLVTYLAAHATVHHIQEVEGRAEAFSEGDEERLLEYGDKAVCQYLEKPDEREAHNRGIEIADRLWAGIRDARDIKSVQAALPQKNP